LVATGTGLAPYMSMIRSELCYEQSRRVAIIHGAYHSWDLGYHGELVTLARVHRMFTYIPIVSAPEEEPVPWTGRTGLVQETWESGMIDAVWGFPPSPDNTHVFLCGHPAMIVSMEEIIKAKGFVEHTRRSAGQYHLERYW
jgi:ferredoxin--NADP+ reductase